MRMLLGLNGFAVQSLPCGPFPTVMPVAKSAVGSPPMLWPVQSVALRNLRSRHGPPAPMPSCPPFVRRPRGSALRASVGGTPFVPTPSVRHGAQRRARAAPLGAGTGPARSHAQRPASGASMASTGRTHPLPVASTVASSRTLAEQVIHRGSRTYARRILGF